MARSLEYKPLLFTTTMRNPGRLKYMLYVLNKFEGHILDDDLATKICGETIRYGLYRPMKKLPSVQQKWQTSDQGEFSEELLTDQVVELMMRNNPQSHKEAGFAKGWPSRFATIFDLTKELGLAWYTPGEPIVISSLAHHLLRSVKVDVNEAESFVTFQSHGKKKIRAFAIDDLIIFLEHTPSLYDYSITQLEDSTKMVDYADNLMSVNEGISILSLSLSLQEKFGQEYASMGVRQWHNVVRDYVERHTRRYDIPEEENVQWMVAAESSEMTPIMATDE